AYPDMASQLRIAARLARDDAQQPAWASTLGSVILYLPSSIDAAELALLAALGQRVPVFAALAWLDDPQADTPMLESAEALARALGATCEAAPESVVLPRLEVLSAPDPDEEVRTVVRRVLAAMEAGVPLWRMAVLYTDAAIYGPLTRETLDAAGVA